MRMYDEGINRDYESENNLIMIGTVSAINEKDATARVLFTDRDDSTSKEIPLMFLHTKGMRIYAMPEVGEQVVCLFLPNGHEEGYILGAYYNDEYKPPVTDQETKIIMFKNGDYVKYKNGTMEVKCSKVNVLADVNISGDLNVSGTVKAPTHIGNLHGRADTAGSVG